MYHKVFFLSLFLTGIFFAGSVHAASLNVFSSVTSAEVGETVSFTVAIDTEGVAVNAAQATIRFSKDQLEIISVDTSDSVFNFWVEGPTFSNETGIVSFLGGSSNGFNGSTLPVVRITAKIVGEGVADIVFADGTVAASDGQGTNVLTAMHNVSVVVSSAPVVEPPPEQIEREPVPAAKAPLLPAVEIPLYPDPTKWYNQLSSFLVRWELPADVSGVATALDQDPNYVPQKSEGLFNNKTFRISEDGVWYLHVRFRNNVGWGETYHARIAVDTLPPTPFAIAVEPGLVTDVPTPTISFASADAHAELKDYSVQIDNETSVSLQESSYTLPALSPGEHVVTVSAEDNAGNSTSASVELTTIPIVSPVVSPIRQEVYADEGELDVAGSVDVGMEVFLQLVRSSGEVVAQTTVAPDAAGAWSARFDQPLKKGEYTVVATARDERGAQSLPVVQAFSVQSRPFVVFAGVEISEVQFFTFIILLLAAGYVVGWQVQKRKSERLGRSLMISQRDIVSASEEVSKELSLITDRYRGKTMGEVEAKEMQMIARRVQKRMQEVVQYITDYMQEIKR